MQTPPWCWFATGGLILGLLWIDLAAHRRDRGPSVRKVLVVSGAWIAVSVAFGVAIGAFDGWGSAGEYFGVYLTEKTLSVDNIFVFAVLFRAFAVPTAYQRRVLFYGVFGALLLRAAMITIGVSLVEQFGWILYILGGFLVVSGVRMVGGHEIIDPARNVALRLLRRVLPVTSDFDGQKFFSRASGMRMATPLLLALLAVEVTDIFFAADSIPAAFGITGDVFVIFTANAFAVLGLRSLYFLLAGIIDRFTYVNLGIAALLVFIGCKMMLEPFFTIPIGASLAVIIIVIAAAIGAGVWHEGRGKSASTDVPARNLPERNGATS